MDRKWQSRGASLRLLLLKNAFTLITIAGLEVSRLKANSTYRERKDYGANIGPTAPRPSSSIFSGLRQQFPGRKSVFMTSVLVFPRWDHCRKTAINISLCCQFGHGFIRLYWRFLGLQLAFSFLFVYLYLSEIVFVCHVLFLCLVFSLC